MSLAMEFEGDKTYEDGKQYSDDDKLLVKFEVRAVKNEFETNKQGRPIYYDADYIHIITPGDRNVSVFPMDESYARRFKKRYEAWKASAESDLRINGTLLAELPWMTKSQIAELNYSNVFTVEQLADMSDANAMKFMGNNQLRQRAKNFLQAAAGEAVHTKLQQELEQRDLTIQTLQKQVDDLKGAFEKMAAESNKRR
jgi:hypothetical protein